MVARRRVSRGAGGRWAGGRARRRCLGPGLQVGPRPGVWALFAFSFGLFRLVLVYFFSHDTIKSAEINRLLDQPNSPLNGAVRPWVGDSLPPGQGWVGMARGSPCVARGPPACGPADQGRVIEGGGGRRAANRRCTRAGAARGSVGLRFSRARGTGLAEKEMFFNREI